MTTSDLLGRKFGESPVWDDLRVPVTSTTAAGSNPPQFAQVLDSGEEGEGFAVYFNGADDYGTIPHDDSGATPVYDFADTWSMSFWSNLPVGLGNNEYLFYHPSWSIRTRPSGVLRIELNGKTAIDTGFNAYLADQRNHFVFVVTNGSPTSIQLYINGILIVDETRTGTLEADGGEDISIAYDGSSNFIEMSLDDLRFFDIALDQDDVDDLYLDGQGSEIAVQEANTISYYKFNENSGTEAGDELYAGATTHLALVIGDWIPGLVDFVGGTHGIFAYHFSPDVEQELFFICQLPHHWIQFAKLKPHIHWLAEDDGEGNVVWGLEYSWSNVNDVFPNTTTITNAGAAGVAHKHLITVLSDIEGEDKRISSMLMCRVFRKATDEADTYAGQAILLEIDFHIQSFAGSREEYTKGS